MIQRAKVKVGTTSCCAKRNECNPPPVFVQHEKTFPFVAANIKSLNCVARFLFSHFHSFSAAPHVPKPPKTLSCHVSVARAIGKSIRGVVAMITRVNIVASKHSVPPMDTNQQSAAAAIVSHR